MKTVFEVSPELKALLIVVLFPICVVGISTYILKCAYETLRIKRIMRKKQNQLRQKKDALAKKLGMMEGGGQDDEEEVITSLSVADLLSKMESRVYSPQEVMRAYQKKALVQDRLWNFITDLNEEVDSDLVEACLQTQEGALLRGIPVSIKDSMFLKGCDCTYGMPSLCLEPSKKDSVLVRTLRNQGAVPFVMTNMSQTGKSIDCSNPIFGETLNPHNKDRTCGGSSGGEGAILASGASLLGVGGDVGGSIRIPAAYCGVFGLKPTSGRLGHRHTLNAFHNQDLIRPSMGPMARRFQDLVTLFRAMTSSHLHALDPLTPPLCFNDKLFSEERPLRIGFYTHLGPNQVSPVPATIRAVELAKRALEAAGHCVVEFQVPEVHKAMFELYIRCMFSDGGYAFINEFLRHNPVDPSLSLTVQLLKIPNILKKVLSYALYPFNKNYSFILHAMSGQSSVYELWTLNDKLKAYRELVLTEWQDAGLDGLICPVLPIVAPLCNTSKYIMDILGYTAIYNVLDYAAGSVPVTTVSQDDIDTLLKTYPKDTPTHRKIITIQKDSVNMPVGVQCVALPWQEEVCLRIMRDIDLRLLQ